MLGENGAGKSTLMNILAGLYRPDSGEILLDGRPVAFNSPRDAIAAGVGMVHQHFTLVPSQTVTENVILGLDSPRFLLRTGRAEAKVGELAKQFGLRVDPRAKIWQLSVGEQQRVEILKLLYRGARILIMDEPTAVLAPQEIDELFRTLRSMTAGGRSVAFISHKLGEVLAIADRITVMRRGKVTAAGMPPAGSTRADLARLMVGREVIETVERTPARLGDTVLEVSDVEAVNDRELPALRGASFTVRSGEIVGIAAIAGNGQSELAEVITGLRACSGRIRINGRDIANASARQAIRHGIAHIPEDRTGVGSAPNLSVVDNLIMKSYRTPPIAQGWLVDTVRARGVAEAMRERYAIAAPVDRHRSAPALGRQPPAPDPRPRDRVGAGPDHRRPADAGPGRRGDRVGPSPAHGAPCRRRGDPPDHRGARRDHVAGGSGRRDVRGSDRRIVPGGLGGHRADRAAHDRRRGSDRRCGTRRR